MLSLALTCALCLSPTELALREPSLSVVRVELAQNTAVAQVSARAAPQDPYWMSDTAWWITMGFGVLHHADELLGQHVSLTDVPLAASLLVYPIYLTGKLLDAGPLYWTVATSVVLTGVLFALIPASSKDTMAAELYRWAPRASTPRSDTNVLGVHSAGVGRAAQGISLGLTASITAQLAASVAEGLQYGFTLQKRRDLDGAASVTVVPTGDGLALVGSF